MRRHRHCKSTFSLRRRRWMRATMDEDVDADDRPVRHAVLGVVVDHLTARRITVRRPSDWPPAVRLHDDGKWTRLP